MNNIQWLLTINRVIYPYRQDWEGEERKSEKERITYITKILLFETPKEANDFFFNRLVKSYKKKYPDFQQWWIDVDSYSFSEEYNYEIADNAEYRDSYDNYDFELSMNLQRVDVKKRLIGMENFKRKTSSNIDYFSKSYPTERDNIFNEVWDIMRKCRFWD